MPDTPTTQPAIGTERPTDPLPRGRHGLSRDHVEASQRLRLAIAMAEVCHERGYADTPVAAVLDRAGVSRQTFYVLYANKLECFLDTLDLVGAVLLGSLADSSNIGEDTTSKASAERAVAGLDRYFDALVEYPAFARLYVVETYAAGYSALLRRAELQSQVVEALAALLALKSRQGRFVCESFVAAVSAMVTLPLVGGDVTALRALRDPLAAQLRSLAIK